VYAVLQVTEAHLQAARQRTPVQEMQDQIKAEAAAQQQQQQQQLKSSDSASNSSSNLYDTTAALGGADVSSDVTSASPFIRYAVCSFYTTISCLPYFSTFYSVDTSCYCNIVQVLQQSLKNALHEPVLKRKTCLELGSIGCNIH
jgi:hypothetical protein